MRSRHDFVATDDADGGPNNAKYISVIGGQGDDRFIDGKDSVPETASAFGSFRVDYDNEKWSHDGFDDDNGEWGDNGEDGVFVNLSNVH